MISEVEDPPLESIPRILHYVWVGPRAVPGKVLDLVDGWRQLNPDYQIILWNEENIDFSHRFVQTAYGMRAWNRVSDFVRMWALLTYGGVYLDTDIELRRPLDDLLDNQCFLGFQLRERHMDWVNGAVLGAVPGHWLIRRLFDYFNTEMQGWEEVGSFYGPGLITQTLREFGLDHYTDEPQRLRDVTLYPCRYFYPFSFDETFTEACVKPDTYAIHYWEDSWKKGRSIRQRLNRLALRNVAWAAPSLACRLQQAYVRRQKRELTAVQSVVPATTSALQGAPAIFEEST